MSLVNFRSAIILALSLGVAVTACGDDSSETAAPVASVDGHTYLSTGSTGFDIVDGSTVRMSFDAGNISVNAGCNTMFSAYAITDGTLSAETMAMTEMACEPALMDQDTFLAAFLTSAPAVALTGDELTLTSGDASISFLDRKVADPDLPLEGTTWVVDTIITGDATSSVPGTEEASITITDGIAAVDFGCNTGSGDVTITAETITFGPLAMTLMACADDAATLESAVVVTLSGEVTYEIEAQRLTLTNGVDGLSLHAAP
jgi:heat shock protein HslJ